MEPDSISKLTPIPTRKEIEESQAFKLEPELIKVT